MPRGGRSCAETRKAGEAAESTGSAGGGSVADEADESDATDRGGNDREGERREWDDREVACRMRVAARIGEGLRKEIERGRRPRVGDG